MFGVNKVGDIEFDVDGGCWFDESVDDDDDCWFDRSLNFVVVEDDDDDVDDSGDDEEGGGFDLFNICMFEYNFDKRDEGFKLGLCFGREILKLLLYSNLLNWGLFCNFDILVFM